jgi:hypothetical protein
MKHLGQLNKLYLTQLEMKQIKYHRCGCHVINSSGKKVYLKSNINYHGTHKPKCLLDQRINDKRNKEYAESKNI